MGKRLVDAEIDDDGTGEKDAPTHRLGRREAVQLFKQSQLRGIGRDGHQEQRRQRIESVAMLSHVAKLSLLGSPRPALFRNVTWHDQTGPCRPAHTSFPHTTSHALLTSSSVVYTASGDVGIRLARSLTSFLSRVFLQDCSFTRATGPLRPWVNFQALSLIKQRTCVRAYVTRHHPRVCARHTSPCLVLGGSAA